MYLVCRVGMIGNIGCVEWTLKNTTRVTTHFRTNDFFSVPLEIFS